MKLKAILFDLDGTLLPMDQDAFVAAYFKALAKKLAPHGYDPALLPDAIQAGVVAMVKNDGRQKNEAAFWDCFAATFGERARADRALHISFYENEFGDLRQFCGCSPYAAEAIATVHAAGLPAILATNPVFPAPATEQRIRWAGLTPADFAFYTVYDNASYCKPNPAYYLEIAARLGLRPEECAMVGNDVRDDMVAATLGMPVFLLTDCLINKSGADISRYPHGDFPALLDWLRAVTSPSAQ